ncbi:glucose-1-phosphate thymidylyltransferase [Streptomyces prasinopilosus]|uniref:Glucose-1-phosphate thymidylyltransferase n=1 Tax=Streptomyces prasinopilosus TaxID=67344 RepID=A0A1G6LHM0_9ACTN|nr:glucose-1-phosphate thymidylyltransferase [Streptomyces prasinopilosus]
MYLGDGFVVGGIADLVDKFRAERPDARILLTRASDPSGSGAAEGTPQHPEKVIRVS